MSDKFPVAETIMKYAVLHYFRKLLEVYTTYHYNLTGSHYQYDENIKFAKKILLELGEAEYKDFKAVVNEYGQVLRMVFTFLF